MGTPLLTVILPSYNAWPYVKEAVDSILAQTFKDLSIIIINDGSTDASADYFRTLSDPRIRLIEQDNLGVVVSFNKALQSVDTEFVARMDADDRCHPEKYELQVRYLKDHPKCVLVGTSAMHLSADGQREGWPVHMPTKNNLIIQAMLRRRSALINPTFLARTAAIKEVGGYHTWPAEDYELFFNMGLKGELANLPDILYSIRLHTNSVTAKNLIKPQSQYEVIRRKYASIYKEKYPQNKYQEKFFSRILLSFDIAAVVLYRAGITKLLNQQFISGYLSLFGAMLLSPARTWLYVHRKWKALQTQS
ncbi:glycosyltransferase [bacterium]|nr:MAG: glycosyltransferase [bacterium]